MPVEEGVGRLSASSASVAAAPGLGALPFMSFEEFELSLDTVARVNLGNGNLLVTSNDGVVNGPSLAIRNDRFYNGLGTRDGRWGGGWHASLEQWDVNFYRVGNTATFWGPNGFEVVFTKSGTTWTPPAWFQATLEEYAPGTEPRYNLTYNQTGEQYLIESNGAVRNILDRNGVGIAFGPFGSGRETVRVNEAAGRWMQFTTSSSVVDSAGREWQYTRNAAGQLSRVDKPEGMWEEYFYNAAGQLRRIDSAGTTGTGMNGAPFKTEFTYDSAGRLATVSRGTVGYSAWLSVTTFAYSAGQTTVTDGNGHTSTYAIDAEGRVTSVLDPLGNTRSQTWTASSQIATSTDALGSGSTPGNQTTYSYDTLNNATGVTLPTGAAASAAYTSGVSCAGTGGTNYQAKCSTDAAGNGKSYDYDAAGNLTGVTDSTAGGTGAVTFQYTYEDATGTVCGGFAGQICTATDGRGKVTSYAYDGDGNLVTVTPPAPQGATSYDHDSLGRVISVTDGNGDTTDYSYDERDQIVSTSWDSTGGTLIASYYPNGLLQSNTDSGAGTRTYTYDSRGLMLSETVPGSQTITYSYDAASNLLTYFDISGTVKYVYDAANQLTTTAIGASTTCATAGAANCVSIVRDANGQETSRTLPGGATITTVLDLAGRTTRITGNDAGNTTRVDIGYSYTAPGGDRTAIQSRTSYLEQGVTPGAVTAYSYDSLNRLTAAVETAGTVATASWAYAYDAAGNRTSQTRTGTTGAAAGTITYSYDDANRITGTSADTTAWAWDAAGNLLTNGITGKTHTYNSRQATTGIGSTGYTSFGQGNTTAVSRTNPGATYVSGDLGLTTEDLPGQVRRSYTRDATGEAHGVRYGGTSRFNYVTDALGSVVGLFDQNGAWAGGYSYSPYGEARATGACPTGQQLRYIAGYLDPGSGLSEFE